MARKVGEIRRFMRRSFPDREGTRHRPRSPSRTEHSYPLFRPNQQHALANDLGSCSCRPPSLFVAPLACVVIPSDVRNVACFADAHKVTLPERSVAGWSPRLSFHPPSVPHPRKFSLPLLHCPSRSALRPTALALYGSRIVVPHCGRSGAFFGLLAASAAFPGRVARSDDALETLDRRPLLPSHSR